jgi:hypothetical protein
MAMERNRLAGVVLSAFVICGATSLVAHHSAASAYDTEKKVTFKGTVTKLDWKNPHVFTYIDVVDESGKVTNWAIEGSTPNQLYRAGWRKTDLKPGDIVTVTDSSPARNGTAKSYGGIVTLPDGRRVLGGSAATDR